MLKLVISTLIILLASPAFGQQHPGEPSPAERIMQLRGFKGLNTRSADFAIQPNEARIAHDLDFSRNQGAITKRYGYDSVATILGQDSIVAIYSAYYSDGTQQLFIVTDSNGVGYGNVYITQKGSSSLAADSLTLITTYWGIQGYPTFAMFDDNVYIANGTAKGGLWNGDIFRTWPIPASGEPKIIPMSHASGELNGEYIYDFKATVYDGGASATGGTGYVSTRIKVSSGRVNLRDFTPALSDSIFTSADSVQIFIYRSNANPGPIRDGVKVYLVDAGEDGRVTLKASDSWASPIFIDSIADDNLQATSITLIDNSFNGLDSTGVLSGRRYGAPGYIAGHDTTYSPTNDTLGFRGLFYGIPDQRDTLGVCYVVTFIDTSSGIEADSGRALFVYNPSGALRYSNTVTLPKIPEADSGLVVNLYRALIRQITYETQVRARFNPVAGPIDRPWVSVLAVDTVIADKFYLVGQFSASDTIYTDSIRYDSLETRRRYFKPTPPALLDNLFSFDGRLWGTQGSRLWFSDLLNGADTLQRWGQMEFIAVNNDDGDEIVVAYPTRGLIRVQKNKSNYNVYRDAARQWSLTEISGHFGCIAPRSHVATMAGNYYLSGRGIVLETEGLQLERTQNISLVSKNLDNFDKLSITTKSEAIGFAIPGNKIGWRIGDTTYVFDEIAQEWSTWSLTFSSVTLYGVENSLRFLPGDTMYFVKPGESTLRRYATLESDWGVTVVPVWKSGPILQTPYFNAITAVELATESDDSTANGFIVSLFGEMNTSLASRTFDYLNGDRYHKKAFSATRARHYQIRLTGTSGALDNTLVDGIDIYFRGVATPDKE